MDGRKQEAEFRETLRQTRIEPAGVALEGLCNLELERVKNLLLDATPDQVAGLQGEGRTARKILKYLTAPVIPSSPKV